MQPLFVKALGLLFGGGGVQIVFQFFWVGWWLKTEQINKGELANSGLSNPDLVYGVW